jgi:DNA-directed RNA polymerase specialized sigma24 family protein
MSSTVRPRRTGNGETLSVYQLRPRDARVAALARKRRQAASEAAVEVEEALREWRRSRPRRRATRLGIVDISREEDRRLGLVRGDAGPVHEANLRDPVYRAAREKMYEALRASIGEIPYDNRVILFGMVALGLNSRAVAEVMGMAHTTVCGRLNRILEGLALRLRPHLWVYQEGS